MDTTGAVITVMPDYPGAETRVQVRPMMRERSHELPQSICAPRALLFDMDGTLTAPALDFPAIKAAMGIPVQRPILEALAEMPADQRAVAEARLHEYEDRAALESKLNRGCDSLIEWVIKGKFK